MLRQTSLGLLLLSTLPRPAGALTTEELFAMAFERSRTVRDQAEVVRIQESRKREGYAPLFPALSVNGMVARSAGGGRADALTLRADQPIFARGAEYSELAAREATLVAERERLEDARDNVRYAVTTALLQGALAREKDKILEATRETQTKRVTELQRRFRLGQTREPDLIQAELESERIERRIIDAKGQIDVARRDLQLATETDLPDFSFPELDALVLELREGKVIRPRAAFEVGAIERDVAAADARARSSWRGYLPTVSAYATNSPWRSAGVTEWTAGLQAGWTFFEGLRTPREVEQALAEKRRLEIRLANERFTKEKNLVQLRIDRDNAVTKLRDLRRNVERGERALRIQQEDYRRGIVTEIEVQTTIQAVLDLNLEQAELRHRAGQLRVESLKNGGAL